MPVWFGVGPTCAKGAFGANLHAPSGVIERSLSDQPAKARDVQQVRKKGRKRVFAPVLRQYLSPNGEARIAFSGMGGPGGPGTKDL